MSVRSIQFCGSNKLVLVCRLLVIQSNMVYANALTSGLAIGRVNPISRSGPTEISRTWSCSDLDIHFNGRIRIESSLQLLKYRSYCSVLYVYPEKVGRRIE